MNKLFLPQRFLEKFYFPPLVSLQEDHREPPSQCKLGCVLGVEKMSSKDKVQREARSQELM